MSNKPTLVFVHGSWHSPECWDKVISELEGKQLKCIAVDLPTNIPKSSASFSDDVRVTRAAITTETSQGNDVVVIQHSYGGPVGDSAVKGFTPNSQTPGHGSTGHVIGIVKIATGFAREGFTVMDGFGGKALPFWKIDEKEGTIELTADLGDLFYHDLAPEEAKFWVGRLRSQALKGLTEGHDVSYAGWKEVPVWYIATVEDKALPIQAQRFFVQESRDAGGNVTLTELGASHSPMLSKPKETATIIIDAVAAFTRSL